MEDVVNCENPDRLSILTYHSQFYHNFYASSLDYRVSSISEALSSGNIKDGLRVRKGRSTSQKIGAVQSLMDGRRTRSMSALRRIKEGMTRPESPLVERANPFTSKTDITFHLFSLSKEDIKAIERVSSFKTKIREKKRLGERMVQSMFVENMCFLEASPEFQPSMKRDKQRSVLSHSSYAMPYKHCKTTGSASFLSLLSLHSQTQDDAREQRRSPSQPPNHMECKDNMKKENSENNKSVTNVFEFDKNNETKQSEGSEHFVNLSNITEDKTDKTKKERQENDIIIQKKKSKSFLNNILEMSLEKLQKHKKKKTKKQFVKRVKTFFGNIDYPFLYTLA